jgi:hypothetical protein
MVTIPAGDVDYDRTGVGYSQFRRPDPRIAAMIHAALGDARTVLNIGAGAGSYEPADRHVVAIEPSAEMRRQRPRSLSPAIIGRAEELPLDDQSIGASMATLTVHQWRERATGLAELLRVTRGAIVIMTFDGDLLHRFWLGQYAPEVIDAERSRYMPMDELCRALSPAGRTARVHAVPIPIDCTDGFTEAYYARPERFLDLAVTKSQSAWNFVAPEAFARFQRTLAEDLRSGAWDARYAAWRTMPTFDGSLRLIVSTPDP